MFIYLQSTFIFLRALAFVFAALVRAPPPSRRRRETAVRGGAEEEEGGVSLRPPPPLLSAIIWCHLSRPTRPLLPHLPLQSLLMQQTPLVRGGNVSQWGGGGTV